VVTKTWITQTRLVFILSSYKSVQTCFEIQFFNATSILLHALIITHVNIVRRHLSNNSYCCSSDCWIKITFFERIKLWLSQGHSCNCFEDSRNASCQKKLYDSLGNITTKGTFEVLEDSIWRQYKITVNSRAD